MATSYGYGGSYTTTSYGAQGGAEGGGFMGGGSQAGSQDTPGGSKTYGKDTLRPVTIKQIIDAQQPHPDAEFKVDGQEMTQITFVGQVRAISVQATNQTFKLDDGTGLIEVKVWLDVDAGPSPTISSIKENTYVRVLGRLKAFNNKKHVAAHVVRPITDFNEINAHLLEATYAGGGGEAGAGGGLFVDQGDGTGGAAAVARGGRPLPQLSAVARKVYNLLNTAPQNNEGLNVQYISANLGLPMNEVFKAGDELLGLNIIYPTMDDETWMVMEY
ncbi:hypothetical protein V490_02937 [Pseudogymnoascus sp. VKM F-3557]|nr:hypothetical protein V490_02937 [Pseudogymnoascus sp. VKM F-3557]